MSVQEQEKAKESEEKSDATNAPVEPASADKSTDATSQKSDSPAPKPSAAVKNIRPSASVLDPAKDKAEDHSFKPEEGAAIREPVIEAKPAEEKAETEAKPKKEAAAKSGAPRKGGRGDGGKPGRGGAAGGRRGGKPGADNKRGGGKSRGSDRSSKGAPMPKRPPVPVPIKPIFDIEYDDELERELEREMSDFENQIESYLPDQMNEISGGDVVEATIVGIRDEDILLDVGDKAECSVPKEEFLNEKREFPFATGDTVRVYVKGRSDSGQYQVSYKRAERMEGVMKVQEAFEKHQLLQGFISKEVKGGLIVEIFGVQAFMPASHIDLHRVDNLQDWVGKTESVYIIDFSRDRKRIIASRRAFLDEENQLIREAVISKLSIDEIIGATVKSITDFGAFVDLGGGVDGLIPREEISWERGGHPSDYVKVGDPVQVKVLSITRGSAKTKISLSRKQAKADPFEILPVKYPEGTEIEGEVVGITHFGAFVRIEEGIQGMVHVSDLSWSGGNKRVKDFLTEGQKLKCVVLEIDQDRRRLSLGVKQLADDPWELIEHRFPVGARCEGEVTSLVQYGAFVKISDELEGLVHISDFSWDRKVTKPSQMLKKGDQVQCVVLEIDGDNRRLSLGIKQLTASPFEEFLATKRVGDHVEGTVTKLESFGAFIEVATNVEGLLHASQISEEQVADPADVLKVGEKLEVKITKIDRKNEKVSLSRREALRDAERQEIRTYMKAGGESVGGTAGDSGTTLFGEMLREAQAGGVSTSTPKDEADAEIAQKAKDAERQKADAAKDADKPKEEEAKAVEAPAEDAPAAEAEAAAPEAEQAPAEEVPSEEAAASADEPEAKAEEASSENAEAAEAEAGSDEEKKPEQG
jgi:small subunit ribosomal protein S1